MQDSTTEPSMLGHHSMTTLHQDGWRCADCRVLAIRIRIRNPRSRYESPVRIDWLAPDGRTWMAVPGQEAPSCPLPAVEALCPWRDDAMRYAGAKGDVQLDTAMRTWCETHQRAVSECLEPGPYCPGAEAHADGEEGRPGPCTGRENTCQCMCPPCCGDTPDMYGYVGDY